MCLKHNYCNLRVESINLKWVRILYCYSFPMCSRCNIMQVLTLCINVTLYKKVIQILESMLLFSVVSYLAADYKRNIMSNNRFLIVLVVFFPSPLIRCVYQLFTDAQERVQLGWEGVPILMIRSNDSHFFFLYCSTLWLSVSLLYKRVQSVY